MEILQIHNLWEVSLLRIKEYFMMASLKIIEKKKNFFNKKIFNYFNKRNYVFLFFFVIFLLII